MRNKLLAVLTLLGLLLLVGQSIVVRAQSGDRAKLSFVNPQDFPAVTALLDVFDAQGRPITGLLEENVTVLEDGQPYPVIELVETTPPAQIVVAVNPGPALAVRDGTGNERFKQVTDVLAGWAAEQSTDPFDDLSLVTVAGPVITHASPSDWAVSLTSFQPDFRSTTPNVQVLTNALNTAIESTPRPGMKRAILVITPRMDDPNIDQALNEIAQYAISVDVRIFVWFVDADLYFDSPSAAAFKALALQTGGSYFAFSGLETLPDPESYFAPLRHIYSLSYTTNQTSSGMHTLAAEVQTPAGTITSDEGTFELDVQPPNPILVMPPSQIVRQAPADDPFNTELLLPEQQQLEIIIEFPDNHPRPIVRTTLYVDGEPSAQNDVPPFDRFTWDLSAYVESVEHLLIVEVVDSLGMSKTSLELPVTVTVVHAPTGAQAALAKYRAPIAIIAMVLAGSILVYVLLGGRLRIKSRSERRVARARKVDPVTQPVPIQQAEPKAKVKSAKRRALPIKKQVQNAHAFLTLLGEDDEPESEYSLALVEQETTFGTDPIQAMHVLDHPSVAGLHARLTKLESDEYLLIDNETVAGTWVNYDPIPKEGHFLAHGDVVHFGQLKYRFTLKKPPVEGEPKITLEVPAE